MKQEELNKILELHKKWLNKEKGGVRADLRGVDLQDANLSVTNLSGVNLSGANLSYANLSYANLTKANLSRADLRGANLRGAELEGANLRRANLGGANLGGAYLPKPIILMPYHKHPLQFNFNINELRIGCQVHSFEYWLEKGSEIGDKKDYSKKEQKKLRKLLITFIEVYS